MWRHVFRPAFCCLVLLGVGYAAYPFATALMLHSAIKSGNAGLIESMVEWDGVRTSLKASILARLDEQARQRPSRPSLLQKVGFKLADYMAPKMIDYMIASRVTPEGFIQYMGAKEPGALEQGSQAPNDESVPVEAADMAATDGPAADGPAAGGPAAGGMLERIRRAKFVDYDRFEFQVVDRFDPGKEYLAVFELRDFFWQLTRVEMLSLGRGA